MFTVLFAYVGVFFACFVARDLCRSGYVDRMTILPPPPLPIIFSLSTILSLTQVTVI